MPRLRAWFKTRSNNICSNLSSIGGFGEIPTVSVTTDSTPDLAEGYTKEGNVVGSFSYMWSMLCHRWQSHKLLRGVQGNTYNARYVMRQLECYQQLYSRNLDIVNVLFVGVI